MYKSILKIYNYYWSADKVLAQKLKPVIGFVPVKLQLFKKAFYHKSMNNEGRSGNNNERLEYLGDAVLSTIVAEYLFKKYPNKDEGFLTKMRSKIVKRKTLNEIADKMGIDIVLANYSQGSISRSMLGNALEALVGAIYLEFGYDKTKTYVIQKLLLQYLDIHALETHDDNYKSKLLEWCQKENKEISYKTISKTKMDKRDRFKVAVFVDGKQIATAEDFNKKSAELLASQKPISLIKVM
ncbi:MAG: ribonuclease III [Saprospiraceae bacterium]